MEQEIVTKFIRYILPFIPFFTRSFFVIFKFKKSMREKLQEKETQRTEHRNFISILSGFSFSALLAVVILQKTTSFKLPMTTYYLFLSFICYYFALNVQSYKSSRWHDQIGTAFIDIASLSLLLSVLSCLLSMTPCYGGYYFLAIVGFIGWFVDHTIRLRIEYQYLKQKEAV